MYFCLNVFSIVISKKYMNRILVRLLAMTSTLMAGSLVFLVAGNTDLYEVLFKTTGVILGTLLAIYTLGK